MHFMQTSQLWETLLDGQCDTDSLRRSLHGFVEHGGIQVRHDNGTAHLDPDSVRGPFDYARQQHRTVRVGLGHVNNASAAGCCSIP